MSRFAATIIRWKSRESSRVRRPLTVTTEGWNKQIFGERDGRRPCLWTYIYIYIHIETGSIGVKLSHLIGCGLFGPQWWVKGHSASLLESCADEAECCIVPHCCGWIVTAISRKFASSHANTLTHTHVDTPKHGYCCGHLALWGLPFSWISILLVYFKP